MSRRALLAGGAGALIAGCGEDDSRAPAPASVALAGELRAERGFERALREVEAPVGGRLADRAAERARRLEAAGAADDGAVAGGAPLELGRAALVAHVGALPSFTTREQRSLAAELLAGAATDVAVLADALREPLDDPFPGTP